MLQRDTARFGLPILLALGISAAAAWSHPQTQGTPAPTQKPEPAQPNPTKKEHADEAFVLEKLITRAHFENDGTGRRETELRILVQSEAGVQQLGQLGFGYNSASEELVIEYVRVLKGDGTVVTAKPDAVQDLTAPVAREAPVYTDFRQKHVTVPGLRPGEILEYKVTTKIHTALAPGHFWFEYDFEDDVIVLDEQLELSFPASRTPRLKTAKEADPQITEAAGRKIYAWKKSNTKRPDPEDKEFQKRQRRLRKHPEPPPIQMTTFQSWEEVGRWYAGLEKERIAPNEEIRRRASELIGGRTDDAQKIEAIYSFVARNFRYVSLSFGLGRYQPHAASEVLANQYGDCKDKHTLLSALLEASGLHAYPALIHSGRKVDAEMPSPSQFDHVISVVPVGKEYFWMDTTTEVAPFRLLSANLRNKNALVVPHDAAPALMETPANPPFSGASRVVINGEVSPIGKLTANAKFTVRGDNELQLRYAFRRTPQAQWQRLAQRISYSAGVGGDVSDLKVADAAATDQPFEFEFKVESNNFLEWSKKKLQLNLPIPSMDLPGVSVEDEEDPEPLELGSPLESYHELTLKLPESYSARAPVPVAIARDYADYRSSYKWENHTLHVLRTLKMSQREIPSTRTRDYLAFHRAVRADEQQDLNVENSAEGTPTIPTDLKAEELNEAAVAALQNDNYPAAIDLFRRVIEKEPKHKGAWNNLGRAHMSLRQFDDAAAAFRQQIELNPFDEHAHNNLGRALREQGKLAEAEAAFKKQLEVNPLDVWANRNLGHLYRQQRRYEDAAAAFEKAISIEGDDANSHIYAGEAYLNLGRPNDALAAFDKAVALEPSPMVWNNISYQLALKRTHLDRAQQYAESAVAAVAARLRNAALANLTMEDVQAVSSIGAYWDTLGWVHFQRGELGKAEVLIRASWLIDFHGEVGDHLAQIYEKQGKKQDAIRQYAISLHATRPPIETRGRLDALAGGAAKAQPHVDAARETVAALRTVKLGKLLDETAEADFWILFAPGNGSPRVEDVKFIRGSEKLKPLAAPVRSAKYLVVFPEGTPTRLIRRATLACRVGGDCRLTLIPGDHIASLN